MQKSIIKLPEVIKRTSLSRSSIYLKISKGEFPKQISLSERSIGFIEDEVNGWIDERIKASRPSEVQ